MMKKTPLYLTGMLLMLTSISGYSQAHKELSLSRLWELTADQYPSLAEKQAKIGESEYRKKELRNAAIPTVQLQLQNSLGTFEGTSGAFFPVPGVFNVSGTGGNGQQGAGTTTMNSFGSVLMDWKISQFGKQQKQIEAAGYEVQEAQSNYDASKLSLRAKTTRRYLDLLYTSSGRDWADKNAVRVKEILDLSVSLAEAGLKPGADTALAAAAFLQAQAQQEDWNGKYQAGQVNIKELAPTLVGEQIVPLQQYMGKVFTLESTDSVVATHPFLQTLDKQLMVQQLQKEVIGKKQLPSISLLAGYSARGTGINADGTVQNNYASGFNNGAQNYLVGVGLSWNLTGLYTGSVEKKRAQKQIDAAQSRYQLQKLQMNTSLQALSSRIQAQVKQVAKTESAVHKTTDAYDLYLSRYEAGLINLTDLLQIQSLLQQVEKSNIEVHQELWTQLNTKAELSGDYSFLFNQLK
ncbi:TolC family protein [Pedobacter gandavensis]|uniref:TolC family protein n=1 Tax=Pedobacter gandavensis TaxID=2679963 RepID=UPI002930C5C2|nr:TolC family protein [Pedobacter gandavensis]